MAWPFPENLRPLMRDVLFWAGRGESWEQIQARLTGPDVRHRMEDVEQAIPEARRALYFAQELQRESKGLTIGEVWLEQARAIWYAAYGREPTAEEREWYTTRPGRSVGMMFEVTVDGVPGFRAPLTINANWSETMAEVRQRVEDYFRTSLSGPPPPESMGAVLAQGGRVNVNLIGGALVPRIEPTIG